MEQKNLVQDSDINFDFQSKSSRKFSGIGLSENRVESDQERSIDVSNSVNYMIENSTEDSVRSASDIGAFNVTDPLEDNSAMPEYMSAPPSSSTYLAPPGHLYNSEGMLRDGELVDVCDCLREDCVGCHFPCRFCRSCKCGNECRQNRRWIIECAEIEGTNTVIYNKHLHLVRKHT